MGNRSHDCITLYKIPSCYRLAWQSKQTFGKPQVVRNYRQFLGAGEKNRSSENWMLLTATWVWKQPLSIRWECSTAQALISALWDTEHRFQPSHVQFYEAWKLGDNKCVSFWANFCGNLLCSYGKWIYLPNARQRMAESKVNFQAAIYPRAL